MYINKYDFSGESARMGRNAESSFEKTAKLKGYTVSKSSKEEDMIKHFDFIIVNPNGKRSFIDVKARKKLKRGNDNAQDDWIWIEFKNVGGNKGWLYGEAEYIAFELENEFIIVKRQDLIKISESLIDRKSLVDKPYLAKYKTYHRNNRPKELVGLISLDDLKTIDHAIWPK